MSVVYAEICQEYSVLTKLCLNAPGCIHRPAGIRMLTACKSSHSSHEGKPHDPRMQTDCSSVFMTVGSDALYWHGRNIPVPTALPPRTRRTARNSIFFRHRAALWSHASSTPPDMPCRRSLVAAEFLPRRRGSGVQATVLSVELVCIKLAQINDTQERRATTKKRKRPVPRRDKRDE